MGAAARTGAAAGAGLGAVCVVFATGCAVDFAVPGVDIGVEVVCVADGAGRGDGGGVDTAEADAGGAFWAGAVARGVAGAAAGVEAVVRPDGDGVAVVCVDFATGCGDDFSVPCGGGVVLLLTG